VISTKPDLLILLFEPLLFLFNLVENKGTSNKGGRS
jgi:hypothetical protein